MRDFSQAILDSLAAHIAVIDNNGLIISVNKSWMEFYKDNKNNSENNFIGENYLIVCQKDLKDGIEDVLNGKQKQFTFEYPCHSPQQLRWFLLRATPILLDGINEFGAVISHVNITDRKKAELNLAKKEEYYRLITESSTDFISTHTISGIYKYASPICHLILGYLPSELIGKSAYSFFHPEDREKIIPFNDLTIKKNEIQIITYRIRCKNNKYIWFETKFQRLFNSDGDDEEVICISRDITTQQLKLLKLQSEKKLLQQTIHSDELTGLYNRRFFNKLLDEQFEKHQKLKNGFSVLMIDIDYFKQYNDTFGHLKGDDCLILVSNILKQYVRESDFTCRFGGEEFCIILPNTSESKAITLANRLRKKVEQLRISHLKSIVSPFLTISIGVASIPKNKPATIDAQALISKADQALYKVKQNGRNNVMSY